MRVRQAVAMAVGIMHLGTRLGTLFHTCMECTCIDGNLTLHILIELRQGIRDVLTCKPNLNVLGYWMLGKYLGQKCDHIFQEMLSCFTQEILTTSNCSHFFAREGLKISSFHYVQSKNTVNLRKNSDYAGAATSIHQQCEPKHQSSHTITQDFSYNN